MTGVQDDRLEGSRCRIEAPAKVNLHLGVGRRRADGFHEIDTLFQAIDLVDVVELALVRHGLELHVEGPFLGPVEDNLVYRAAQAFVDTVSLDVGVRMSLWKRIPAGAGLGGGSSDAAAVLRGLNALTQDPLDATELMDVGASLGSDVPFFLGDATLARGRGRGERITPLDALAPACLVLVVPPVHVATGEAYGALAAERIASKRTAEADPPPDLSGGWKAIAGAANDFESGVAARHPPVAQSLKALREAGASPAMLSGSGAACFGLFGSRAQAEGAARDVREAVSWQVEVVSTLDRFPTVG